MKHSLARLFVECYNKISLLPTSQKNFRYYPHSEGTVESVCPLVAFLIASGFVTIVTIIEKGVTYEMTKDTFGKNWSDGFIDGFDGNNCSNFMSAESIVGWKEGIKVRRTFQRMHLLST